MDIRLEQPGDQDGIRALHTGAFATPGEARLVDLLRTSGRLAISLVAEIDGSVVGHVALSPVELDGTTDGLGLAPVAVAEAHRRHGIASQLIREALAVCGRSRTDFVVVLGDPAFYSRLGFEPASRWKLSCEYGGGEEFRAIELRPGAIPAAGGPISYAPEFIAVG